MTDQIKRVPYQKFMTLTEIRDKYQDSVLCRTTREAKESGEWFKKTYTQE